MLGQVGQIKFCRSCAFVSTPPPAPPAGQCLRAPKLWGGEKNPENYRRACGKALPVGQCLCDRRPMSSDQFLSLRLPSPKFRGGAGGGVETKAKSCKIYFVLLRRSDIEASNLKLIMRAVGDTQFSTPPPAPPAGQCLCDRWPMSSDQFLSLRLPSPKLRGGAGGGVETKAKSCKIYFVLLRCRDIEASNLKLIMRAVGDTQFSTPPPAPPVGQCLRAPKLWGGEKNPENYGGACGKALLVGQCLCDRRPMSSDQFLSLRLPSPKLRGA